MPLTHLCKRNLDVMHPASHTAHWCTIALRCLADEFLHCRLDGTINHVSGCRLIGPEPTGSQQGAAVGVPYPSHRRLGVMGDSMDRPWLQFFFTCSPI